MATESFTTPRNSYSQPVPEKTISGQPHPFYVEILEQADERVPSTESVCKFLLSRAIGAARDRNSDEMMFWQRPYLDVKSLLRIGFDFDTYYEKCRCGAA